MSGFGLAGVIDSKRHDRPSKVSSSKHSMHFTPRRLIGGVVGLAPRSAMVYPPPGLAREDWKIVRALSEFVGVELPYSDSDEMAERVYTLVPSQMDEVTPSTVSSWRCPRLGSSVFSHSAPPSKLCPVPSIPAPKRKYQWSRGSWPRAWKEPLRCKQAGGW